MKKLIFIPTMLLILFSMTIQAQGNFVLNPNGEKDQAVVRAYIQAMTSRNAAQLGQTHAPDYLGYGPRWDSPQSREKMLQNVQDIWDNYDNIRYDRIRMISVNVSKDEIPEYNGNWVFVWGVFLGKEKATGKEVSLDVHETLKIENGKIRGKVTYYNELDGMIQAGQYNPN
jgi:hypothetical protein